MKTDEIIKSKLITIPKTEIATKLGYASSKKAIKALDKFVDSKNLHDWLHSGYFDFKHTALSLFEKLCEIIDIDKTIIEKVLLEDEKYNAELERFKDSYIYVNTNFKRKNEPIFALACLESQRRLKVPLKNLLFKTVKEILKSVSDFIVEHYLISKGDIGIWGKALNYVFHHNGNKYIFDTKGNRVYNVDISETIATLKLKLK